MLPICERCVLICGTCGCDGPPKYDLLIQILVTQPDWTTDTVALRCKVHRNTVSRWANGGPVAADKEIDLCNLACRYLRGFERYRCGLGDACERRDAA